MSTNLPEDLDLNFEAVPMEDQIEVSRGSVDGGSEMVVKGSVSETEVLIGGDVGEVRVSEGLVEGSGVGGGGNLGKEVKTSVVSVLNGGGGVTEHASMSQKGEGIGGVKMGCSIEISGSLFEETGGGVEGDVAGIINLNVLGENRGSGDANGENLNGNCITVEAGSVTKNVNGVDKSGPSVLNESHYVDAHVLMEINQNMENVKSTSEFEHRQSQEKQNVEQTGKKDGFSTFDMVWGKVRSHPWWPGQIFDPSEASEQAMKHFKPDRFLVAYFGDESFAWNEASSLKPFKMNFSQMEKQSNTDAFCNAVDCALDEVSIRAELGLSCSCLPAEVSTKMKTQVLINSGLREEVFRGNMVNESLSAASFEPDKLVEYMKSLAMYPCGGTDRLELVVARAQLASFYRLKGYFQLPEFHAYGGLSDNKVCAIAATPVSQVSGDATSRKRMVKNQNNSAKKGQHISGDGLTRRKKDRSLTDSTTGTSSSLDDLNSVESDSDYETEGSVKLAIRSSGKKRKNRGLISNDSIVQKKRNKKSRYSDNEYKRPSRVGQRVSRPSRVGQRVSRIASQLTGSPSAIKFSGSSFQKGAVEADGSDEKLQDIDVNFSPATPNRPLKQLFNTSKDYSSTDEMLSQLCLAAQNPMKRYSFISVTIGFFTNFRNSINLENSYSAKAAPSGETGAESLSKSKMSCIEPYEYENVSDSYWTDRIVQGSPEGKPSSKNQNGKADMQLDTSSEDHKKSKENVSVELSPALDSKKGSSTTKSDDCLQATALQNPDEDSNLVTAETTVNCKDACEFSPTELILNFTNSDSIPPEMNLNDIFSRFGPLKESETEILRKTSRARVVFERHSDAEVAFSSAGKFSTFGPALKSYQLKYLSSTPSKASPHSTRQTKKDAALLQGDTS